VRCKVLRVQGFASACSASTNNKIAEKIFPLLYHLDAFALHDFAKRVGAASVVEHPRVARGDLRCAEGERITERKRKSRKNAKMKKRQDYCTASFETNLPNPKKEKEN